MVYVSTSTPYMTLFKDFLAKKHRLAVDAWGADDTQVKQVYKPFIEHVRQEIPQRFQDIYPFPVWKMEDRIARLSRNILVSEFLVKEWAEHFVGKSDDEIDEIAKSFAFGNCDKREELNRILTANALAVQ